MMQPLTIVPLYTDRYGRPIGTAVYGPTYDALQLYNPMPKKNGAPPLWNALHLPTSHPMSTASSDTPNAASSWSRHTTPYCPSITTASEFYSSHKVMPVIQSAVPVIGVAPYTHISSWDAPLSLDRDLISIGDGTACPQFGDARFSISRYAILAQVQEVGNRHRATQVVESIISLLKQDLLFGLGWEQTINDLRMEVVRLFRSTFSAHRPIAPSAEDIVTGNDAWARAASKANEVAALLLELIRLGVNTPDDLTVAAGILAANHSPGYMPLLRSLLATGRYLSYSYSGVLHLKEDVLNCLPGGGGLVVNDIRRIIRGIPLPPRK